MPIGTSQRPFNGTFNGNGHTFTNMVISRPDDTNVAIFAVVDDNGVISNLHLGEGCAITGGTCVGSFAGLFSGKISDCTTALGVNVKATYKEAGGIVGRCVGTIERCVNQASVSADDSQAGGIAASTYYSSIRITDNLNLGSVTANKFAGGIVGYHFGIFSSSQSTYTNNYYAGNCAVGAINGSDYNTMAQRGYTVTGGNTVEVSLVDDATVGVPFNQAAYAGAGQQVIVKLSKKQATPQAAPSLQAKTVIVYQASDGELVDNNDGTWTLTMPEGDVEISIKSETTDITTIYSDATKTGRRYNLMGQPVGNDYKGIVIEDGRKLIVK